MQLPGACPRRVGETQWNLQPSPTMSPKKKILRELSRTYHASERETHVRPATIAGFTADPERYQKAVNELLQARLIEGRKDEEGRMAIALNAQRMEEVRRHLRPAWAHPAVWASAILLCVVGASFSFML